MLILSLAPAISEEETLFPYRASESTNDGCHWPEVKKRDVQGGELGINLT